MTAAPYQRTDSERTDDEIFEAACDLAQAVNRRVHQQNAFQENETLGAEPADPDSPVEFEDIADYVRHWADALDSTVRRTTAAEWAELARDLRELRDQAEIDTK